MKGLEDIMSSGKKALMAGGVIALATGLVSTAAPEIIPPAELGSYMSKPLCVLGTIGSMMAGISYYLKPNYERYAAEWKKQWRTWQEVHKERNKIKSSMTITEYGFAGLMLLFTYVALQGPIQQLKETDLSGLLSGESPIYSLFDSSEQEAQESDEESPLEKASRGYTPEQMADIVRHKEKTMPKRRNAARKFAKKLDNYRNSNDPLTKQRMEIFDASSGTNYAKERKIACQEIQDYVANEEELNSEGISHKEFHEAGMRCMREVEEEMGLKDRIRRDAADLDINKNLIRAMLLASQSFQEDGLEIPIILLGVDGENSKVTYQLRSKAKSCQPLIYSHHNVCWDEDGKEQRGTLKDPESDYKSTFLNISIDNAFGAILKSRKHFPDLERQILSVYGVKRGISKPIDWVRKNVDDYWACVAQGDDCPIPKDARLFVERTLAFYEVMPTIDEAPGKIAFPIETDPDKGKKVDKKRAEKMRRLVTHAITKRNKEGVVNYKNEIKDNAQYVDVTVVIDNTTYEIEIFNSKKPGDGFGIDIKANYSKDHFQEDSRLIDNGLDGNVDYAQVSKGLSDSGEEFHLVDRRGRHGIKSKGLEHRAEAKRHFDTLVDKLLRFYEGGNDNTTATKRKSKSKKKRTKKAPKTKKVTTPDAKYSRTNPYGEGLGTDPMQSLGNIMGDNIGQQNFGFGGFGPKTYEDTAPGLGNIELPTVTPQYPQSPPYKKQPQPRIYRRKIPTRTGKK
jgi:hypothetical protein